MRELLSVIQKWFDENKQVAVATVVEVSGSAPRGIGAKMVVNEDGQMAGSVSGGCVEGAVVEEALKVIKSRQACLLSYGISHEQAFSVGLACGGAIKVFVRVLLPEEFSEIKDKLEQGSLFAQIFILDGKRIGSSSFVTPGVGLSGEVLPDKEDSKITALLPDLFARQQSQCFAVEQTGLFFDVYPPVSRLIVVGAVHIAIPLVEYARMLGFHTILVDPRKAFSNRERFPHVDELIQSWPQDCLPGLNLDEGTYFVTLSHDDKLDVPSLEFACRSKARYIGALGSKKTFARRKEEMLEEGLTEAEIARVHSPVGIKIGARGAEEIALSVMAEIIAVKNGLDPLA